MTRTKRKFTKKELVTDPIHAKAGPHKDKKKEGPKICPVCRGSCVDTIVCDQGHYGVTHECGRCRGEGVIYD